MKKRFYHRTRDLALLGAPYNQFHVYFGQKIGHYQAFVLGGGDQDPRGWENAVEYSITRERDYLGLQPRAAGWKVRAPGHPCRYSIGRGRE
jgi:hypothetical protein